MEVNYCVCVGPSQPFSTLYIEASTRCVKLNNFPVINHIAMNLCDITHNNLSPAPKTLVAQHMHYSISYTHTHIHVHEITTQYQTHVYDVMLSCMASPAEYVDNHCGDVSQCFSPVLLGQVPALVHVELP